MTNEPKIPITETAIQWVTKVLQKLKVALVSEPEIILKTPYSSITKFSTEKESFYLKETPPDLFIEAEIIKFLKNEINAIVPSIIAVNKDLHCFLMLDSGISLRNYLKENFKPDLLIKSIDEYTNIQLKMANHVDDFIKIGVPDWRLEKMPMLYRSFINQEAMMQKYGLTDGELKNLQDLYPTFVELSDILSKSNIPETIDHCDFHDNNILINPVNHQITLIDLGEIVITYPFFSLLSFISKAALQYSLNDEHPIFIKLINACFENWLVFSNKKDLNKAMLIAKKIWPIYSGLGYYRLIESSGINMDKNKTVSFFETGRNLGRFAKYFQDFIRINLEIAPNDVLQVKLSDPGSRFK